MEVEEEEVGAGSAALAEPAAPAPSEKEQEAPTHTAAAAEEMVDPSAVRLQGAQPGQPLGLKRVLAVDLPVLCASPMTAVSMLGGLDRLSAACTGKSRKLQFYFRPDDELSIPLGSQIKQPSSRLLLRIKVRRDRTTGKKVVARTEVLGSVSTTFRFNALADFQYLTTQSFLPSGTPDVISKTRLEIVPSSYETSAFPGKYAYTTLKSSALATNETARRQNVVIRFGDAIPEAPPDVLVNRPRRRSEKYNQVLEKLQAFFDRVRLFSTSPSTHFITHPTTSSSLTHSPPYPTEPRRPGDVAAQGPGGQVRRGRAARFFGAPPGGGLQHVERAVAGPVGAVRV